MMARFTRQSDSEPLMRLERPSTASSQTTAHIINSCFNEILCHKPLDSEGINNLAVSKRSESNECEFQDYYVDKLKRISDDCSQRLDEISQVERHLMQARAKALAEDEKNLASLVVSCPSYKETGLPLGPSQYRKYLDEELLARHKLLIPSQYIPLDAIVSLPPQGAVPMFMQTAKPSSHNKTQQNTRGHTVALKPPWQECLTTSERKAEKKALSELNRKTTYLKNPRYCSGLNNTASYGPLRRNRKTLEPQTLDSFVIDPSEVMFTVYEPGGTYKLPVEFKNVSGMSRQLRLIPLKSSYFSVSRGYFPTEDGLIAPGMKCSFIVTFTPDSLASYEESMKVLTSNGEYLEVSLVGMRPPPVLSLPRILDCGSCLVGDSKIWSIQCENSGGEGNFKLILSEDGSDKDPTTMNLDSIAVGSFLVSPPNFHISASGGKVDIHVTFTPPEIGQFTEDISMACDNGQVLAFTLKGIAEKVCVGCIHIRPSAAKERLSFNPTSRLSKANAIRDAITSSSYQIVHLTDVLEAPCISFSHVNPHNSLFLTVLIHNFSNVDLPYIWKNYRPLTRNMSSKDEKEQMSSLVPSKNSPFSICPSQGTLSAKSTSPFTVRFSPEMFGSFVDMGYFILTNKIKDDALNSSSEGVGWIRLSDSSISVVCLQMQGICDPYSIELNPLAIIIPGKIPISTHIKKKLTITNHSHCTAHLKWSSFSGNNMSITVNPRHGRIVSGGTGFYEVVILGHSEGHFSSTLCCSVDPSSPCIHLHVRGCVQGPVISLGSGHLNFGLIPLGRSSSLLKTSLSNESNCSIDYTFQQLVQNREKGYMDHSCLSFLPSEGKLLPYSTSTITIECRPKQTGRFKSIVELLINGDSNQYLSVEAEVQRPQLCLTASQIHFDEVYVGISNTVDVSLRSNSLIPAHFTWSTQVFGIDSKYCKVNIRTMTGRVGPKDGITLPLEVTWSAEGSFKMVLLNCSVLDMEDPLILSLSANVKGLSVVYKLLSVRHQTRYEGVDDHIESSTSDESDDIPLPVLDEDKYVLDFGGDNELGKPVRMSLKVVNTSAIPTSLEASVSYFPVAIPHTPLPKSDIGGGTYLLRKSKVRSKTAGQEEYASSLLRGGHGVCFLVEPSSSNLPGFGSVILKITAYSDMWGTYYDQLTCKVNGLEDNVITINFGVIGSPIKFVTTASSARTLVRFGSHPIGTKRIRRTLKVKNCGPLDIRVNWKVFCYLKDDDKIFDLITTFGDPFPLTKNVLASNTYPHKEDTISVPGGSMETKLSLNTKSNDHTSDVEISITHEDGSMVAIDGGTGTKELARVFPDSGSKMKDVGEKMRNELKPFVSEVVQQDEHEDDGDLINVILKMHDGVESYDPFNIHPKQSIIPAQGNTIVEVTYLSTHKAFVKMGDVICGYATGHVSIDAPATPHVTRKTGFDVEPIRINMMGGIEEIELSLECEDDKEGLYFRCPASLLLQDNMEILPEVSQVHKCTLINTSNSLLQFDFSTTSSYFFVDDIRTSPDLRPSAVPCDTEALITMKPRSSLQFSLRFSFTPSDIYELRNRPEDSNLTEGFYEGSLQIKFSTGALQVFPLSAVVKLPVLTLSRTEYAMGLCHLGKTLSSMLDVTNVSLSSAVWTTSVSLELEDVVSISPESGLLNPHLHEGKRSTQLVTITFSPRCETSYDGIVILYEVLTGKKWTISISGIGSADENIQSI